MIIRIHGIKRVISKGRIYYYHRATRTRLIAEPGSHEFFAEVKRLDAISTPPPSGGVEGTWSWLVTEYKRTPEWSRLSDRTKIDYNKVFNYIADGKLNDAPLSAIDTAVIIKFRNKTYAKKKRRFTNYVLAVMSRAWSVVRPLYPNLIGPNPVTEIEGIRRERNARIVNRPWTDAELTTVLSRASQPIRRAVAIAAYAGIREGDILRLPASAYDGQIIESRHHKTGEPLWIPAHKNLREILNEGAPATTRKGDLPDLLVINQRGRQFTESGFRASFFTLVRNLIAEGAVNPGLTFHGLRHTVATRLAEAGASTQDIMAVTGHLTESMVKPYTIHADKRRRARRAVALLEQEEK